MMLSTTTTKYAAVLQEIMTLCERYAGMFNIESKRVVCEYRTDVDETLSVGVGKKEGRLAFIVRGHNFDNTLIEVRAEELADILERFNIPPSSIKQYFLECFSEPLGKYLARQVLSGVEKEVQRNQ